jgi:hypothetical protein
MAKGKQSPLDLAQNAFRVFPEAIGMGPHEELAYRAFSSLRDLWSVIDRDDDINVFRTDLLEALQGDEPLELVRRAFLDWGHSLDLLSYSELYKTLTNHLADKDCPPWTEPFSPDTHRFVV